jgi:hypothetical protein
MENKYAGDHCDYHTYVLTVRKVAAGECWEVNQNILISLVDTICVQTRCPTPSISSSGDEVILVVL